MTTAVEVGAECISGGVLLPEARGEKIDTKGGIGINAIGFM
jgi:hypothetical protein